MAPRENCDPALPAWLCVFANTCGYISNAVWFLVLLPQLLKNYWRRSTSGLSFIWASCNFCASLINLFFVLDISVPLFTRISGWYMPVLEVLMLLQFALYSDAPLPRKLVLATVCSVVYATFVALECTNALGEHTSSHLVWISIVLWSVETYFQVVLNMRRRSVDGQSYVSLGLTLLGKTTDVIMQFSLKMPVQYVYMTYFSSTLAYFNILQLVLYTQRRWYSKAAVAMLSLMLCGFIALLLLRTSIVSIVCPIGIALFLILGSIIARRPASPQDEHEPCLPLFLIAYLTARAGLALAISEQTGLQEQDEAIRPDLGQASSRVVNLASTTNEERLDHPVEDLHSVCPKLPGLTAEQCDGQPHPKHATKHKAHTRLNLVCDRHIIDRIRCVSRPKVPVAQAERYIKMAHPCSAMLPLNIIAARLQAQWASDPKRHHRLTKARHRRGGKKGDGLHKHRHSHHRHHATRPARPSHPTHHKHKVHRSHPYRNRCVTTGNVCASKLYGCRFNHTTLYSCSAVGKRPVAILPNAKVCGGMQEVPGASHNGDGDSDCQCTIAQQGHVCGTDLPRACGALSNAVYDCSGSRNRKPLLLKACSLDSQCSKRGGENADCIAVAPVGPATTLPPVSTTAAAVTVATVAPIGTAVIATSIVPVTGNTPATVVAPVTRITPAITALPVTAVIPAITSSPVTTGAPVVPVVHKSCKCPLTGFVCGAKFSSICGLDAKSLYKCDDLESSPALLEKCKSDCSTTLDGTDTCTTNRCTCPGSGTQPVCGVDLPPECNARLQAIYVCPDGQGSEPQILEVCQPGTLCQKRPAPICGPSTCDCNGDGSLCSHLFPGKCGLVKNALYRCSKSGEPELVKSCADHQVCVQGAAEPVCVNDECTCSSSGVVCGATFPASCGLKSTAKYNCLNGESPVFLGDCYPGLCVAHTVAGSLFDEAPMEYCVDQCQCSGKGLVCGLTFPPECDLRASDLYSCSGLGDVPYLHEECGRGGCAITAGDNACNKDSITCPGLGLAPICGYELPGALHADTETIYYCPGGSGTAPELLEICRPGLQCQKKPLPEGAVCGAATCTCFGEDEVCSMAFPDECGLEKNTIYRCTASGIPEKVLGCLRLNIPARV
ncbi:hypothetical protein BGZ70_006238 [Mortierella alpina]|uniref:Uncharacterized protein n=1 Tax=Mortierella alpina TaxID=64518 RepID=A0A9P6M360_MORAP|nr:hypothetical protein BGZ70_006238 [Mortierella alpina]